MNLQSKPKSSFNISNLKKARKSKINSDNKSFLLKFKDPSLKPEIKPKILYKANRIIRHNRKKSIKELTLFMVIKEVRSPEKFISHQKQ